MFNLKFVASSFPAISNFQIQLQVNFVSQNEVYFLQNKFSRIYRLPIRLKISNYITYVIYISLKMGENR